VGHCLSRTAGRYRARAVAEHERDKKNDSKHRVLEGTANQRRNLAVSEDERDHRDSNIFGCEETNEVDGRCLMIP